jgi:CSLREA domain-containing protein
MFDKGLLMITLLGIAGLGQLNAQLLETLDAGNNAASAMVVSTGGSVSITGNLKAGTGNPFESSPVDVDVYKFTLLEDGVVRISGNSDQCDVNLLLLDGQFRGIQADDDSGSGGYGDFNARIEKFLPAGTYYVAVGQNNIGAFPATATGPGMAAWNNDSGVLAPDKALIPISFVGADDATPAPTNGELYIVHFNLQLLEVTTTADIVSEDDGLNSLREAIAYANSDPDESTITFDAAVTGSILLTSGSMTISSALTILGPGANVLAVNGGGTDRLFLVMGNSVKTISGLTLTNGHAVGSDNNGGGGAIFNLGGGPIDELNSTLTLDRCAITGSTADTFGGGILNFGTLNLLNSTVSGNTANGNQTGGGGIGNAGQLTIINSTLSGNSAPNASGGGGGLTNGSPAFIFNSTITGNQAGSVAGGISSGNFTVTLQNTIVAGNTNNTTVPDVGGVSGFTSQGNNLIGNAGTVTGFTNGDIVGASGAPIDAMLGPLANNGGPTQTHALLAGSPAINAGLTANLPVDTFDLDGDSNITEVIDVDQRGVGFVRVAGPAVDIGAVEAPAYTPTITNATTDEETQTFSGLVISANEGDAGLTTHYQITAINGGTLFKSDGTTAIAAGDFITRAEGTDGLKFTPGANFFGTGSFEVQASTGASDSDLKDEIVEAQITINPIADTPSVTDSVVNQNQQTTTGLVLSRNAADGAEVTHFKITSIHNGTLYKNDGTTVIASNSFITFAEGAAGLRFTPTNNFLGQATFAVQAAVDASGTGLSNTATATITVGTATPTALQVGTAAVLNRQTGLYEMTVNVMNTTAFPIFGFRLHANFGAYLGAHPTMRLYNATSAPGNNPAYVDHPFPVALGQTVPIRLTFYTANRQFPNPFAPVLTVETLQSSQLPHTNGSGVGIVNIRVLPDDTKLLEWNSIAGRWYRIKYSSDMTNWYDSQVPIRAGSNKQQWIDNGPPFTSLTSADPSVTARFYVVEEIPAPVTP